MDINFYNKCCNSNLKIKKVEEHLIKINNNKIIKKLKDIKNIRIINKFIDENNHEVINNISIYPGFTIEVILMNNLLIEISCPTEKNYNFKIYIEIDIIDEYMKKMIKDQYSYIFPIKLHEIKNLFDEICKLSMLNLSRIKN